MTLYMDEFEAKFVRNCSSGNGSILLVFLVCSFYFMQIKLLADFIFALDISLLATTQLKYKEL